jgi:ABC-type antimicrobial peptide transport system permease subunit
MKVDPPKRPLQFLRWFCREDYLEEIEGDLTEVFIKQVETSPRKATWRFSWSVIKYFRPAFMKSFKNFQPNAYGMYKSYLKIGWRNLLRNKGFSLINIGGLAIGLAVALIIGLWVFDELSFNKSFKNYDRLSKAYYKVTFGDEVITDPGTPFPFGQELKNNYAEFEDVAMASNQGEHILAYEETKISKTGLFIEPSFLKMFSVEILPGSSDGLKDVHSIFLSKSLAQDLIGDNAVGKMVKFDNRDNLMVAGVFEDFPSNSNFADVKMLLPLENYFSASEAANNQRDSWEGVDFECFVLLNSNESLEQTNEKIKNLLYQNGSGDMRALKPESFLFPMEKWHLYAEFEDGVNVGGKIRMVWMIGLLGIFVLLLACINFMNLSTARSELRSKEVGIRKVMGSVRHQLANQFLVESLLVVMLGFAISIVLVWLCLPWFNELIDKRIEIPWSEPYFLMSSLGFVLLTSLLAGSYPALYLSAFNPIKVLKGTFKAGLFSVVPRKVMVVFQFVISISLIVCTAVVFQQIQYAKDRPIGFDIEKTIFIKIRTEDLVKANYNSLRYELLSTGVVGDMAKSDAPITGNMSGDGSLTWDGKGEETPMVAINSCSHDFPKTSGFQFVAGRDFSREHSSDSSAVIINEMFAKLFPDGSAIGKKVKFGYGKELEVVGVIKDQVRWSPFSKQSPHMYYVNYTGGSTLTIRMKAEAAMQTALEQIEAVIKKYDPGSPFDYTFVDDDYARQFHDQERIGKLSSVFAALAVFISCLGIFGLAAFAASQRNKEIAIRKVLGASVISVWKMLSRDFVLLVVISIIVAVPLAYFFSNQWLQQYDYRIEISIWVFVVASIGALTITLFTVSYQSIKAGLVNPVKSLRSE